MSLLLAAAAVSYVFLSLYIAPFLPFVTALLAKANAPGWLKTGLTAGLATIVTLVTTAIDKSEDVILTWDTLGRVLMTVGLAVVSYLALRPAVDKVAAIAPDKGIGPGPEVPPAK